MPQADAILSRFRDALRAHFGDRIERVVLYGSRARGDAKADSDYDVALFLKASADTWAELDHINALEEAIRVDSGIDIRTIPFPAGSWDKRTLLMHEIRKDGRDL